MSILQAKQIMTIIGKIIKYTAAIYIIGLTLYYGFWIAIGSYCIALIMD